MRSPEQRLARLLTGIPSRIGEVTEADVELLARHLHRERCARSHCNMEHVDLYWTVVDQDAYREAARANLFGKPSES